MPYNIISCSGWESEAAGWVASAPCLKSRIGVVILFFIIAIIRKWGAEEIGINYSFWLSLIAGMMVYILIVTLSGSFKFAFAGGLVAALVLGYGAGFLGLGESEGGAE